MKFSIVLASAISLGLAKADFFEGIKRPELFEITELNMPTIRINFSDEAYSRFKLYYQCLYDTHPLIDNDNEDCYSAPWVNYTEVINSLIQNNVINVNQLPFEQQNLINTELTFEDFKSIIDTGSSLSMKEIFSQRQSYVSIPTFEEKKASFDFIVNGVTTTKDNVKISVGGKYTQNFEKPQFNVNLKDGDLYGIKQIRLRSEVIDPSFLRSKIGSDLTTVLGFPSNQATYSKVLLNDDDMGLYLLRDAIKEKWVETNFGVANTTSLYACDGEYGSSLFFNCVNEDTEERDEDITNFSTKIENVQTVQELTQFFDTELYIKWQAYKYLVGSWDHITNQHNQYLFKYGNKWLDILYDFDSDLGAYKAPNTEQTFSQESLEMDFPLYKLIGLNDDHPQLVKYIESMVMTAFNPVKLIPHVEELIEYLYPYVVEDRTPENDSLARPGHYRRADYKIENGFTVDDFIKNTGFHNYYLKKYYSDVHYDIDEIYGIKRWIIERFRFVCTYYNFDCSFASEYLEGNYEVPSKESTEVILEEHKDGCNKSGYPCCLRNDGEVLATDEAGDWCVEGAIWCLIDKTSTSQTFGNNSSTMNNPVGNNEQQVNTFATPPNKECWSLEQGYPCCEYATEILSTTPDGKNWSVENGEWCGIIDQPSYAVSNAVNQQAPPSPPSKHPKIHENPFSHM